MVEKEAVLEQMIAVAKQEVLPRFEHLTSGDKHLKKDGTLVTIADIECEKRLCQALTKIAPQSLFVGEESVARNPQVLEALKTDRLVWVVDPIDGTNNFIKGSPDFCMMVALVQKGIVYQSWIYMPTTQDIAYAQKGKGAFFNGKRLQLAKTLKNDKEVIGHIQGRAFCEKDKNILKAKTPFFSELVMFHSAGIDFVKQAQGKSQFTHYGALPCWDHMAGGLLLQEAGGCISSLVGDYIPTQKVRQLISAVDSATLDKLRRFLTIS